MFIKTLDPDPDSLEMLNPDLYPDPYSMNPDPQHCEKDPDKKDPGETKPVDGSGSWRTGTYRTVHLCGFSPVWRRIWANLRDPDKKKIRGDQNPWTDPDRGLGTLHI